VGYSIWSASFIAPHIKEDYSGHEHLIALRQLKKYLAGIHLQDEVRKNSKTPSEIFKSVQYSVMKSSRACQTRGHGTAHMA
jgi:hypothetical protein